MIKILSGFLIALILAMPVLACCCPQNVEADLHASHQTHDSNSSNSHSEMDCSSADISVSNQVDSASAPSSQSENFIDYAYSCDNALWNLSLENNAGDRILYFDSPPISFPIYLATQRLRI